MLIRCHLPNHVNRMEYVLEHAEPQKGFDWVRGALAAGDDLSQHNCTVLQAQQHCASTPACLAFTYEGAEDTNAIQQVFFKSRTNGNADGNWSTFTKRTGWLSGHQLSEGGTQIVMSLTQWAEDRGPADRKAVAKAIVAHLLAVAAAVSPESEQSWAATR